jgi:hypothetical protein
MNTLDDNDATDIEITRRHLFKAVPVIGVTATVPTAGAATRAKRTVNVRDFGARGDGITDDTAAFKAALAAAQIVDVPPGTFRLEMPLRLSDGHVVRGAGRSGWDPYTGTGPPRSAARTELVIDARVGFDARDTNNAAVSGLAIRARKTSQSRWGAPPGVQAGAIGIDIAGSLQFDASDISFHGLDVAVSSVADHGTTTQMPRIGNWVAHDCATVFRFVSGNKDFNAVRDARIEGCLAALHCNRIVEARNCDGLRIENARFFQCAINSLLIENTSFVTIVGATLFETGEETVILRACRYVTMSGVMLARAGFYRGGPLVQHAAMLWEGCIDMSFEGVVEQPVGRAITILNCTNLSINATIGTPYWSTGNLASADGAIRIEQSNSISLNATFSGSSYWIAVWADAASAPTVGGRIVTEGSAGVVRCVHLQSAPWGHVVRTSSALRVASAASLPLDELRVLVPPGKSLVSRSVEWTVSGIVPEVTGSYWQAMAGAEPGGGALSIERKVLYRNANAVARYASIPIGIHNPSTGPVVLPAGLEIRLSLAIE